MASLIKIFFVLSHTLERAGGFASNKISSPFNSIIANGETRKKRSVLSAAPEGMKWFVKTEIFSKPYLEVKQHLEAHREWVRLMRENKTIEIASGYRVDENGKPGGGGLVSHLEFVSVSFLLPEVLNLRPVKLSTF